MCKIILKVEWADLSERVKVEPARKNRRLVWVDPDQVPPGATDLFGRKVEPAVVGTDIAELASRTSGVIDAMNALQEPRDKWVGGGWKYVAAALSDELGEIWGEDRVRVFFSRLRRPELKRTNEFGKPEYNVSAIARARRGS
jgi:hypothetical protein